MDDAQLQTIWQQRQRPYRIIPLAEPLGVLMKHKLGKRLKQLGQLAEVWDDVLPEAIRDHTALESFSRGTLTVMVDSASHRFHLQKLLAGGLQKELQRRFKGSLNRVKIVPGQFYSVDIETGKPRYEFDYEPTR